MSQPPAPPPAVRSSEGNSRQSEATSAAGTKDQRPKGLGQRREREQRRACGRRGRGCDQSPCRCPLVSDHDSLETTLVSRRCDMETQNKASRAASADRMERLSIQREGGTARPRATSIWATPMASSQVNSRVIPLAIRVWRSHRLKVLGGGPAGPG